MYFIMLFAENSTQVIFSAVAKKQAIAQGK